MHELGIADAMVKTIDRIMAQEPDSLVRSVTVDGKPIDGNVLPVFADQGTHAVRVVLG